MLIGRFLVPKVAHTKKSKLPVLTLAPPVTWDPLMVQAPPQSFHNRCEAAGRWLGSSCCYSCRARSSSTSHGSQFLARFSTLPHYFPAAVTGAGKEKKEAERSPVALNTGEMLRTFSFARVVVNHLCSDTGLTKSLLAVNVGVVVVVGSEGWQHSREGTVVMSSVVWRRRRKWHLEEDRYC